MIGYVTLGSNDLDRARSFYDDLMPVVGGKRILEFGDAFTMYGTSFGKPGLAVCKPYDGNGATVGNGVMAAIACDKRDRVDAFYSKAMELGASDEGAPGLRSPEGDQAFYAAYMRDPDGNKLCAFCSGPAD